MRIRLQKGKQRELIKKAKLNLKWKDLGKILNLNPDYIRNELSNETRLLSEEIFKKLCEIIKEDYNPLILEKLPDDWGKSKGGKKSKGNTKIIKSSEKNERLAELIGIILGDGHIEERIKDNARCYAVKIAGHIERDYNYLSSYVSNLIESIYHEKPSIYKDANYGVMWTVIHGKEIVKDLLNKGLKSGNKKRNNQGIPKWIKENKAYLKVCLRGLIDTDGSVHCISKNNRNLRICFTSYIPLLMQDTRNAFIELGYSPSKVIKGNQFFITRKDNLIKYQEEIGFSNEKHLNRLIKLAT